MTKKLSDQLAGTFIGYTGSQGDTGAQGTTGYTGSRGSLGYTGSVGPQGPIGYTGSKGDTGATGSQGAQGYTGSQGNQGVQGVIGYTGSKGDTGSQGPIGYSGSQGPIGYTGSKGDTGATGATGSQGPIGYTGSKGDTGATGATGSQGPIGYTGSKGDTGATGATGSQGPIGYTGSKGDIGYTGSKGLENWSVKTSTYTLVDGDRIVADTSGGSFTVTLPSSPSTGAYVQIADGDDWSANNLTIARNGSTIEGTAEDLVANIDGAILELVYSGSTWEVYASLGVNENTLATTSTQQTISSKTFVDYTETVYNLSGTTPAIAANNGTIQLWALTGDSTPTDSLNNGQSITLMIDDGTDYTITWPTITWLVPGAAAPTLETTGYKTVVIWKAASTLYGRY